MNTSVLTDWYENKSISSETMLFYSFLLAFFCMPLGTTPLTAAGMLALAVWLFSGAPFRLGHIWLKSKWIRPVILIVALSWIGLLYTPDVGYLGISYANKTHYWLYAFAMAAVSFNTFPASKLIRAFMAGLGLNAAIAVVQFAAGLPDSDGRFHGIGPGYTTLSSYLIVGMLMAAFHFRESEEKRERILLGLLALLYFFHLAILESRTGYVAFILLSPLIAHTFFKNVKIIKIVGICALVLGMMALSPFVRDRVALSVKQLKHHINADSESAWGREYSPHQDRFYMWHGAVRIFLDNPVLGVGTGGYQKALKQRGKPGDPMIAHPHNSFLYMATSFGVIGIIAFVWLFWSMIVNAWRQRGTPDGFFVLSTALVILASGLFNTQILNFGPAFLLAVAAGLQQELTAKGDRD